MFCWRRNNSIHTLGYRICPNRSAVHECKGLGVHPLVSIIKLVIRYLPVHYAYIYKQEPRGPLFIQGSGNVRMCGSQTDRNIAQILVFLDDLLMFYKAFDVNLIWYVCCWRGLRVY